ncbi:hypothetical protein GF339_15125 [candidate division KSB3 bacterium]|uniref:Uncharacterized protein n=1 Tax=candidate division KSB3 bacterium TaxID=2044937 RepID=A0A9D5Q743_9BACT|nr:hypothetical protein [candidate division KSB3 bacterium]MBD3325917.1 hypothetical protein [candidate division KSB3 bacterium]
MSEVFSPPSQQSFLICHRGALGDFILTWPALRCLREVLPEYRFLGIGRADHMRLAVKQGLLEAWLDMESAVLLDFFAGRMLPPVIGHPAGAVLWLSEGQHVVKRLEAVADLPVVAISPFPAVSMHIARSYCATLSRYFPIRVPDNLTEGFPAPEISGSEAMIHPGSGSSQKNYACRFYRTVCEELRHAGYPRVRVIVGPVEQERQMEQEFAGETVEQPDSVVQLADLLATAALYIGNDSGVSHLAAILGVPAIALYKTTDPDIWGVLGRQATALVAHDEASALSQIRAWLHQNTYLPSKEKKIP